MKLPKTIAVLAFLVVCLAVAFAVMRLFVVEKQGLDMRGPTVFKDLAHVFVGSLLGMGVLASVWLVLNWLRDPAEMPQVDLSVSVILLASLAGVLGVVLTLVEVYAALT